MTDGLDRDELIGLLGRLGDESDEAALAAARAIHGKVTSTGHTWDDLLVGHAVEVEEPEPVAEVDVEEEEREEEAEADEVATDGDAAPAAAGPAPNDAESLRLINRLLDSGTISDELREELGDYKADIEAGDFADEDRKYLRALYRRLKKE